MNKKSPLFALIYTLLSTNTQAEIINFFPSNNNKSAIKIEGSTIEILNQTDTRKIYFDTEKPLNAEIADYNFDKNLDFSIWHIDDGKGVYEIYRIFIYNPKTKSFSEAHSKCGDEFINVNIDRKTNTISSTIFKDNTPTICKSKI